MTFSFKLSCVTISKNTKKLKFLAKILGKNSRHWGKKSLLLRIKNMNFFTFLLLVLANIWKL
jgi:hypothetical protein